MQAASLTALVQYVSSNLFPAGYYFFVAGSLRDGLDPQAVDEKLTAKFGADASKDVRYRRKQAGLANHCVLFWGRLYLILSTHGRSDEFFLRQPGVRDARRTPIRVGGYSLSVHEGHSHVRIDLDEYRVLKARLAGLAPNRSVGELWSEFQSLPFEGYAPVRSQLYSLWREVNRRCASAGLPPVPRGAVRTSRRIVHVRLADVPGKALPPP